MSVLKSPVELVEDVDRLEDGTKVIRVGRCDFRNMVSVVVEHPGGRKETRHLPLLTKVKVDG